MSNIAAIRASVDQPTHTSENRRRLAGANNTTERAYGASRTVRPARPTDVAAHFGAQIDRLRLDLRAQRPKAATRRLSLSGASSSAVYGARVKSIRRINDCPCESGIDRFDCPCCGYRTLHVSGGTAEYEICQVCFWQHDHVDEADSERPPLGPNGVTLSDARSNFLAFGACERKWIENVRPARPDEARV